MKTLFAVLSAGLLISAAFAFRQQAEQQPSAPGVTSFVRTYGQGKVWCPHTEPITRYDPQLDIEWNSQTGQWVPGSPVVIRCGTLRWCDALNADRTQWRCGWCDRTFSTN